MGIIQHLPRHMDIQNQHQPMEGNAAGDIVHIKPPFFLDLLLI